MTMNALPKRVTINAVTEEFLALQKLLMSEEDYSMCRFVVRFFRLCVNMHAPSKFNKEERAFWHQYRIPGKCYQRKMSEFFGPEKMPGEVKFFFRYFLGRDAYVGEDFMSNAPWILKELFAWLVRESYIAELDIPKLFPKWIPKFGDGIDFTEQPVSLAPRGTNRAHLH